MNIHIRYDVFTVRVFDEGKSYEQRDPYVGIITGYKLADDEVFLTAAHGEIGGRTIIQIATELKKIGIKTVLMERQGEIKKHVL